MRRIKGQRALGNSDGGRTAMPRTCHRCCPDTKSDIALNIQLPQQEGVQTHTECRYEWEQRHTVAAGPVALFEQHSHADGHQHTKCACDNQANPIILVQLVTDSEGCRTAVKQHSMTLSVRPAAMKAHCQQLSAMPDACCRLVAGVCDSSCNCFLPLQLPCYMLLLAPTTTC